MGASPLKIFSLTASLLLGLLWGSEVSLAGLTPEQVELVPLTVRELVLDPRSNQPVLLLHDEDGDRVLPVWIGTSEANAIMLELRNVTTPRPMTHDLIRNILEGVDAEVVRVVIHDVRQSTYLGQIVLEVEESEVIVDSRPSDAIALALRVKAPIFASTKVLNRAQQLEEFQAIRTNVLGKYGLTLQELTPDLASHFKGVEPGGILVADVRTNSSASRDGLRRGDLIHRVNEAQVASVEEFLQALSVAQETGSVEFAFSRDDRLHTIAITDVADLQ